jgi:hypothetical protein
MKLGSFDGPSSLRRLFSSGQPSNFGKQDAFKAYPQSDLTVRELTQREQKQAYSIAANNLAGLTALGFAVASGSPS